MEQSLQVMSKQERLENWTARIMACRSSGMTVRAWCQENGLSEKTYYYWQRRLFQTLSEQQGAHKTAFAEVTPPQPVCSGNVAVTVRIAGAEADIHSGADAATVETVLRFCGTRFGSSNTSRTAAAGGQRPFSRASPAAW